MLILDRLFEQDLSPAQALELYAQPSIDLLPAACAVLERTLTDNFREVNQGASC